MAFKMKGSELYGKLKLNRNMDNSSQPDGRAKSSAFQLNPSYIKSFDVDDETGKVTEKKKMVSDAHADAAEKAGKTVERTGLSDYKHQMKGYKKKGGYKKESSEHGLTDAYRKLDSSRDNPTTATGNKVRAEKALKASKSDPEVIAEEKKQAQKFPKDVAESVKLRNIKKDKTTKSPKDEIDARGKEARTKIQKDKLVKRTKELVKKQGNKEAQAKDKKKYETKG